MNNEEIIWLEDKSPHDPLADAIFSVLYSDRYTDYIKLGSKLRKQNKLAIICNGTQINFELVDRILKIEYFLPNRDLFKDFANINLRPKLLENTVDQQLLLKIAEAETNALLYEEGSQFKFYLQPSVGFGKELTRLQRVLIRFSDFLSRNKNYSSFL